MHRSSPRRDSGGNSGHTSQNRGEIIRESKVYTYFKRCFDIIASSILLALFSPIMLVTAIAIVIDSPGPVFVEAAHRVGKRGRLFKMYKFRSMIPNAQAMLATDPRLKKLYEEYKKNSFKLVDDPRRTRVGSFIRKHSIDEFPQLFNVLIGDMSLIGPRPYYDFELKEQVKKYPDLIPYIEKMHMVKPGITGFWQVSGRSEVNFEKRIKLDADYAGRQSILYDILILLKTPWVVISGKGAY